MNTETEQICKISFEVFTDAHGEKGVIEIKGNGIDIVNWLSLMLQRESSKLFKQLILLSFLKYWEDNNIDPDSILNELKEKN